VEPVRLNILRNRVSTLERYIEKCNPFYMGVLPLGGGEGWGSICDFQNLILKNKTLR